MNFFIIIDYLMIAACNLTTHILDNRLPFFDESRLSVDYLVLGVRRRPETPKIGIPPLDSPRIDVILVKISLCRSA
jgi:hypothetical protein